MQKQYKKKLENLDKYIEDIEITEEIKNKRIVAIDPNESDLIFCLSKTFPFEKFSKDKNGKILKKHVQDENLTFRYTQNQRRLETRNKKYNKIQETINKEAKINDKSIKEIKNKLSKFNSKTLDFTKFTEYCIKKNEINRKLFKHYSDEIFRKLKFNRYINTQKSESKMINNFRKKYGNSDECLVVLGDYDKQNNRKGKEPIINRKIRKIFRQNNYEIYLINEFRTSKLCNNCCGECENFLKRESHNPKHKNKETGKRKIIEVWGLVRCTNEKCKLIHNRDKNSALNMYKITKSILNGLGRPKEYCR